MVDIARKRDEETKQLQQELSDKRAELTQMEQARSQTKTQLMQKENKIKMLEQKLGDKALIGLQVDIVEQPKQQYQ